MSIPTLDIRRFDTDRDAFVAELGAAYREWGFCGIRGHGIPQAQIDRAYDVFQRFFALPEAAKKAYHVPGSGGARGYTPFGIETAKGAQHFDLKEFWHVGREIARDSKYADVMPANLWPSEIVDFREVAYGLYTTNSIMDLNLGGVMLQKNGSEVVVSVQMQTTPDLSNQAFTNHGTPVQLPPLEMPADKGFLRIRALGPAAPPSAPDLPNPPGPSGGQGPAGAVQP